MKLLVYKLEPFTKSILQAKLVRETEVEDSEDIDIDDGDLILEEQCKS